MALSEIAHNDARAWYRTERRNARLRLVFGGEWVIDEAAALDSSLKALDLQGNQEVELDGSNISRLDSAGAWLLIRTGRALADSGAHIRSLTIPDIYRPLVETLQREGNIAPVAAHPKHPLTDFFVRVGHGTYDALHEGLQLLNFLGRLTVETVEAFLRPDRELPWPAFINQIEQTGVTAVPIIGLLSFMLGVVLAYQGAEQLQRFGAEIFTVNLVGIAVFREIGGLMTAIIVAGRSGSAFTAQIGTMKLNQ